MKQDHGHEHSHCCKHEPVHHHTNPHDGKIEFFLDDELFSTDRNVLTANQILKIAGLDPADNYLVKIYKGRPGDSFEGKGDAEIKIEECDKFIAVSTGPTPVS